MKQPRIAESEPARVGSRLGESPGSRYGRVSARGGRGPGFVKTSWAWVVLFIALPGMAWAQEKVVREADKTVFRKKTVIDFTDVAVEGELTKPEGSYVLNRNKTRFRSLVRVRDNFVPELQKSVDNL